MTEQTTTEKPLIQRQMEQKSLTYTLTSDDIRAMRKANKQVYFLFNYHPETGYLGRICLEKNSDPDTDGFKPTKTCPPLSYEIDLPAFLDVYGDEQEQPKLVGLMGFSMLYSSSDSWETALEILKKGDQIKLRWGWNYFSSPLIYQKGLVSDSFHLNVYRPSKLSGHDDWVPIYLAHSVTTSDRYGGLLYYRRD